MLFGRRLVIVNEVLHGQQPQCDESVAIFEHRVTLQVFKQQVQRFGFAERQIAFHQVHLQDEHDLKQIFYLVFFSGGHQFTRSAQAFLLNADRLAGITGQLVVHQGQRYIVTQRVNVGFFSQVIVKQIFAALRVVANLLHIIIKECNFGQSIDRGHGLVRVRVRYRCTIGSCVVNARVVCILCIHEALGDRYLDQ